MIIEAQGLARTFTSRRRSVDAVRGVDLAAVCLALAGRAFAKENA